MEKTIARWSYWLGIASVIVTIAWKGGNAFGLWRALPPTPADISYWSFFNASILILCHEYCFDMPCLAQVYKQRRWSKESPNERIRRSS